MTEKAIREPLTFNAAVFDFIQIAAAVCSQFCCMQLVTYNKSTDERTTADEGRDESTRDILVKES